MKKVSWFLSVLLSSLLIATQSQAAYFATLSVGNAHHPVQRWSVAAADEAAELDDLEGLEAEPAKTAPKPKPSVKPQPMPPAPKADAAKTTDARQTPVSAPTTIQRTACDLNDDCRRGFLCVDGSCFHKDELQAGEEGTEYNPDAKQWAFWGGLVGHVLWGAGSLTSLAVTNPTTGSGAAVWSLFTASTIVSNIAANSAIDHVGVRGAPGQKVVSWIGFSVGILTFGALEGLLWGEQKLKESAGSEDSVLAKLAENVDVGAIWVVGLTVPSLISGVLMSSVALRSHRQVRRLQDANSGEPSIKEKKSETSLRFDLLPYGSGARPTGLISQLSMTF